MPLKRHVGLQPLSREHHHGLLLCWKIRTGLKKGIEEERIKKYADWFFKHHLLPHFEAEEKYVFPILDAEDSRIKKALAQHRRLKRLFVSKKELNKNLNRIEETLEQHIRFEERSLFNAIQSVASSEELQALQSLHEEVPFADNLSDPFCEN